MASISSLSNRPSIDILIEQFLDIERSPIKKIESTKKKLNTRLTTLNDLKGILKSLRDTVSGFSETTTQKSLGQKTVTSSDPAIVGAEADSTASVGINTLFVEQLARNDTAVSDRLTSTGTDLFDSLTGQTETFSITVGSNSLKSLSITFGDTDESNVDILNRIKEAINDANIGVTANVINDTSSTSRLTLVSDESGEANALTLDGDLFDALGITTNNPNRRTLSGANGGFVHDDTDELNAKFRLNGIDIISDSNTIENVLSGVTINLIKAQDSGDTAATLKISQDTESIKESIEDFISDFNKSITFLNEKTSINAVTLERGSLAGDFTFLNLRINLRANVIASVGNVASGNPASLREVGITLNRDGTLSLEDEEKLDDALETSSTAVIDLFTAEDGITDRLEALIDRFVPTGKLLDDRRSSIKSRITRVDSRVKSLNQRLRFRERALRLQFTGLQRVLSGLASQQQLLNQFTRGSGSLLGLQRTGIGLFG